MMVMACENGHVEMVRHLVKLGVTDLEGPDGLNALTLAIGQLDSHMVNILANPGMTSLELYFQERTQRKYAVH